MGRFFCALLLFRFSCAFFFCCCAAGGGRFRCSVWPTAGDRCLLPGQLQVCEEGRHLPAARAKRHVCVRRCGRVRRRVGRVRRHQSACWNRLSASARRLAVRRRHSVVRRVWLVSLTDESNFNADCIANVRIQFQPRLPTDQVMEKVAFVLSSCLVWWTNRATTATTALPTIGARRTANVRVNTRVIVRPINSATQTGSLAQSTRVEKTKDANRGVQVFFFVRSKNQLTF